MHLFLMRHGRTAARPVGGSDADRPLSEEGRAQVRAVSQGLLGLTAAPREILTSPLLRARQTAELAGEALQLEVTVSDSLSPEQPVDAVFELLSTRAADARILLVGHQPTFESVASVALSRGGPLGVSLDPASVLWCECPSFPPHRQGVLHGYFPVDVLLRLADARAGRIV